METLHLDPVLPPSSTSSSFRGLFTATELAAAEQLVQLSESSGTFSPSAAAAEDRTSSSSPRSVNARQPAEAMILLENEEEETGLWRRTPWHRPIADVYAATAPVDGWDRTTKQRRHKKRTRGEN